MVFAFVYYFDYSQSKVFDQVHHLTIRHQQNVISHRNLLWKINKHYQRYGTNSATRNTSPSCHVGSSWLINSGHLFCGILSYAMQQVADLVGLLVFPNLFLVKLRVSVGVL